MSSVQNMNKMKRISPLPTVRMVKLALTLQIIGLAVCLFLIYLSMSDYFNSLYLFNSGVKVTAHVIEKYVEEGEDSTDYILVYKFNAPKPKEEKTMDFQGKDSVDYSTYGNFKIGDPLDVYYFPQNPNNVSITKEVRALGLVFAFILLFVTGLFIVLINNSSNHFKDNKRLAETGINLTGVISQCYVDDGGDSTVYYCVYSYSYQNQSFYVKASISQGEYEKIKDFHRTEIPIRCLSDNPKIHQYRI